MRFATLWKAPKPTKTPEMRPELDGARSVKTFHQLAFPDYNPMSGGPGGREFKSRRSDHIFEHFATV